MKDWYRRSIIYSLDLDSYRDGNGDGIGDFEGLRRSLPYLSSLGIDCIWLLPFYPSPNRDNGYDVCDYFSVDPRLGNLGTFVEFMDVAREFNLRVIVDLVANHTSNEHPWFKEALKGPDSPYHDYYIWTKDIPANHEPTHVFGEEQDGNWEYVESLGKYYYHTFYQFQPDLNLTNPVVLEEIKRVMHFWLDIGVAGFRMDAVTHMIRKKHPDQDFGENPYNILKELRSFVNAQSPNAVLLAEADLEPEEYERFFCGDAGMHMLFNFYGNNYLFYALATGKAAPLAKSFEKLPGASDMAHFANFIRNHDELDLERLTESERQKVFERFAPEEHMRAFGRGIRRRFAAMVGGDQALIELGYSLLLSLPGTPVLRYGDEIGMGDDLSLPGREAVRTVMQWSDQENAGFSSAPEDKLLRPYIKEGIHGYKEVNVNRQIRDKDSLLNWMVMAITARRRCPEFGSGEYTFVATGDDEVLVHICRKDDTVVLAVHNFGNECKTVRLDIEQDLADRLIDIFGDKPYPDLEARRREIQIRPKGYRWFRTGF